MFKLVTDRKFMRAVKRVMEELKAAGLKMNSDVCSLSFGARGETLTWFSIYFFRSPPHCSQDALQEIMGLTQGNPKEDS